MGPRCRKCDDSRWWGWEHDRSNWAWFYCKPAMPKAHYPYRCGFDPGAVARGFRNPQPARELRTTPRRNKQPRQGAL